MDIVPVYVGLDYHQVAVQVCVVDETGGVLGNRRCPNDWLAIESWAEAHGQVKGVAIEACPGAADLESLGPVVVSPAAAGQAGGVSV